MTSFAVEKRIGFGKDWFDKAFIIKFLWFTLMWISNDEAKKMMRIAALDENVRNDYVRINEIKGDEYRRGFDAGKGSAEDSVQYWEDCYYKMQENYEEANSRLQDLEPKLKYLESLAQNGGLNAPL